MRRCARYDCRTTVEDSEAVFCPHQEVFCPSCTWEEACIACAYEATFGRLAPTDRRAYAWPDDSAAALIRDDRDHENGARLSRYAEKRDAS